MADFKPEPTGVIVQAFEVRCHAEGCHTMRRGLHDMSREEFEQLGYKNGWEEFDNRWYCADHAALRKLAAFGSPRAAYGLIAAEAAQAAERYMNCGCSERRCMHWVQAKQLIEQRDALSKRYHVPWERRMAPDLSALSDVDTPT